MARQVTASQNSGQSLFSKWGGTSSLRAQAHHQDSLRILVGPRGEAPLVHTLLWKCRLLGRRTQRWQRFPGSLSIGDSKLARLCRGLQNCGTPKTLSGLRNRLLDARNGCRVRCDLTTACAPTAGCNRPISRYALASGFDRRCATQRV